jgi:hypothetical protein
MMIMMMDWTGWVGIASFYPLFSGNGTVVRNASLVWLQLVLSYSGLWPEERSVIGMRRILRYEKGGRYYE